MTNHRMRLTRSLFLRPDAEIVAPYADDLLAVALTLGMMAEAFRERRDSRRGHALSTAANALVDLRRDGCDDPSDAQIEAMGPINDSETLREQVTRQAAHWERTTEIVRRVLREEPLEARRRKALSPALTEIERTFGEVMGR